VNEVSTAPREPRRPSTRVAWLAWSMWGTALLFSLAGAVVFVASSGVTAPTGQFGPRGFGLLMGVVVGTVGAIVATRQPANAIGWLLCVAAVFSAVTGFAAEYVVWALVKYASRPPLAVWALWVVEWVWIPIVAAFGVVFAIFPNGRPISRRWGWAIAIGLVATTPGALGTALVPTFGTLPYPNPIGDGEAMVVLSDIGLLPFLFVLGTGAAALVVRLRRSRGDERQQLKWLALAASWMAASIAIFASVAIAQGSNEATGFDWAENLVVLSFFAIPIAIGVGVLKYRLYDIDVVINRAIVYGALAVFITVVYGGIVVGVGAAIGNRADPLLSAVAAAIVALAFQPLRRRAQRFANRLVYGKRATPYEVLSDLSSRFAETYSLEDALPRLARVARRPSARSGHGSGYEAMASSALQPPGRVPAPASSCARPTTIPRTSTAIARSQCGTRESFSGRSRCGCRHASRSERHKRSSCATSLRTPDSSCAMSRSSRTSERRANGSSPRRTSARASWNATYTTARSSNSWRCRSSSDSLNS
jgi:hypothetical protein